MGRFTIEQRRSAAQVVVAVAAGLVAPGQSATFKPARKRPFNVTISGGVGVVAQLERRFPGDPTWYVKIGDGMRTSLPESFTDVESEAGVEYRVNVTAIASGTATVRLSQ